MKKELLDSLSYTIIPGKTHAGSEVTSLNNKAYLYWREFWNQVFKDNGTNDRVSADDFCRQDMVAILSFNDQIVGMHLYSVFNTSSIAQTSNSYFTNSFNNLYMDTLYSRKCEKVMSLEYLTVDPSWRKKQCGISLATVLIGIACKMQLHMNISALIAPCRSDVKVTQMLVDYGGSVIVPNLNMHNTPCDLVSIFNSDMHSHPNATIQDYVEKYWFRRIDFTNMTLDNVRKPLHKENLGIAV